MLLCVAASHSSIKRADPLATRYFYSNFSLKTESWLTPTFFFRVSGPEGAGLQVILIHEGEALEWYSCNVLLTLLLLLITNC